MYGRSQYKLETTIRAKQGAPKRNLVGRRSTHHATDSSRDPVGANRQDPSRTSAMLCTDCRSLVVRCIMSNSLQTHPYDPVGLAVTMSSIDLVDIINSMRGEGRAELLHKNFMVKIEGHPGIDSAKFLAQYKDSTGRSLKCYQLPKRECELMVMSESLEVQTKVYDHMTDLEQRLQAPRLAQLFLLLRLLQMKLIGFRAQAAILAPRVA